MLFEKVHVIWKTKSLHFSPVKNQFIFENIDENANLITIVLRLSL